MKVGVNVDASKLLNRMANGNRQVEEGLHDWASIGGAALVRDAQSKAPKRRGDLARSITFELKGSTLSVGSNDPKAKWMEFGTRPHLIRPKHAKALRFNMRGKVVFARVVKHPGTPEYKFLRGALADKHGYLVDLARSLIGQHLQGD
jgi:hypothetical protein